MNAIQLNWARYVSDYGVGPHNYCRNPTGEATIWCFTKNASVPWELCAPMTVQEQSQFAANTTEEVCPAGAVPVRLSDLNLEMFRLLMLGNGTLPEPELEPPLGTSFIDIEDDDQLLEFLDLAYDENELWTSNRTANLLLMNVTVCFGKTGPIAILGHSNLTLPDLYEAMEFNRTLEFSKSRGFKPSPSPSPAVYNATGGYVDHGRFMGRHVDRAKRRPLAEIANRTDHELAKRNCTDPEAYLRPECTLPFANLTGMLNSTRNWTDPSGAAGLAGAGADAAGGAAGGSGDAAGGGEGSGGTGGVDGAGGTGEGSGGAGGSGAEGDAAGGQAGSEGSDGSAGGSGSGADQDGSGAGGAGHDARSGSSGPDSIDLECAEDDVECLERQKILLEVCDPPDDQECLLRKANVLCEPDDLVCRDKVLSGTYNATLENSGLYHDAMKAISKHGPTVALGACIVLVSFIAVGAVFTNMMKERNKLKKLEKSLKDANTKQQDEVWVKSG